MALALVRRTVGFLLAALCAAAGAQQPSEAYPSKAFRFVVPFPAGSATDQTARFVARHLGDMTAQPVVVENRAGANGVIGIQYALGQPADGYTVLFATQTTHAANPHLFKKLPYDPQADFVPLTGLLSGGLVLVVHPQSPLKSVQDLVAAARKQPGKLTFGSGNSASRVAGEMMKQMAKVDLLHVPYKGIPQAITDLMGGQIDMLFTDGVSVLSQVRSGKLRAIAVTTRERSPALADIPTVAEQGVPGFEITGWIAAFAPKGTPLDLADKLNAMLRTIMQRPDATSTFGEAGWIVSTSSRPAFTEYTRTELERWGRVTRAAKIEPE